MRSVAILLTVAAVTAGCVAGDWRTDPDTPMDVYWVHGLSSDERGYDGRMMQKGPAAFEAMGSDGDQFLVAYHGCDTMPGQVWADDHGSHDAHGGSPAGHDGDCGGHDSDTPIEHIAHHLSWLVHDRSTARQHCAVLVGHSMGGLVLHQLMADLDLGHPDAPDGVCVRSIVTLGSPLLGADIADLCGAVHGHLQCRQMAPRDGLGAFLQSIYPDAGPEAPGGTRYAHITSEADGFVAVRHSVTPWADLAVSYRLGEGIIHGRVAGYLERDPAGSADAAWRQDGAWTVSVDVPNPLAVAYDFIQGTEGGWPGTANHGPALETADPAAGAVAATDGRVDVEVECTADPDGHPVYVDFAAGGEVVETDRDALGFSPSFVFHATLGQDLSATCRDDYGGRAAPVVWSVTA